MNHDLNDILAAQVAAGMSNCTEQRVTQAVVETLKLVGSDDHKAFHKALIRKLGGKFCLSPNGRKFLEHIVEIMNMWVIAFEPPLSDSAM